jgi:hypothetical protein
MERVAVHHHPRAARLSGAPRRRLGLDWWQWLTGDANAGNTCWRPHRSQVRKGIKAIRADGNDIQIV